MNFFLEKHQNFSALTQCIESISPFKDQQREDTNISKYIHPANLRFCDTVVFKPVLASPGGQLKKKIIPGPHPLRF